MIDASNSKRTKKPTARQRGAADATSRSAAAPKESYVARRRRFFIETVAMLRDINATLDEVERNLTEVREG